MLLRTFTPETLTGSQNFDTFHKPTNVELLANQLVLMETTVTTTVIIQVCINSIASTVTFIVLYYYNMVLLSRHSADTGGGGRVGPRQSCPLTFKFVPTGLSQAVQCC